MIEPLVVIVPAYNAEPTLANVVKGVRRTLPKALIIGVDDGSTDGSGQLMKTVADETIEFAQNRGKGAALRAGFAAALKKGAAAVLTIDSDGQHDPAFATAIVGALDRADIVIGTRDLSGKAVPKHRRIANMISSAATRAVSGGKVRDSQSGYRAMKAEVLRKVDAVGDRYEFETDFIIRAARAGFTTVNVPISTIYGSPSYFREFRDAWLVIKVLWRHRAGIFKR
ncbi:MAG TPA: glycosyltransferase family 2 protein [Gemmatimonadaceae bacterium]|nr:glycosyltransferase family 2 protein [Gemmatimonadaceae bacterium]